MGRFEEGLGRIMFVVGALVLERPFLGPLYRFMSLHPRSSVRRVPPYVRFFLRYLADRVSGSRHYNCAVSMESTTVAPRVDAQASSERTGIGGWFPNRGQDGKIDVRGSRWFSLELNEEEWPWIYARGRKRALIISTLESLAVLVALKLLYGETPRERHTRVQIVPTITDNRGNGALLNKLMSTKFPASAVLMELASYMRRMSLRTVVEWVPREGNKEADKLANGNAEDFDPSLRIVVSASTLSWDILPEALEAGGAAERQSQAARERGALPDRCRRGKRRRPEERLRLKDPW